MLIINYIAYVYELEPSFEKGGTATHLSRENRQIFIAT
jgi:hypothetical protein